MTDSYYRSVLLMNNESSGCWIKGKEAFGYDISYYGLSDIYLRFMEDGSTVKCYITGEETDEGDHMVYNHTNSFRIQDKVLYLDDEAYKLDAYTAGSTYMELEAMGNYDVDISGWYYLGDNFWAKEMYKYN